MGMKYVAFNHFEEGEGKGLRSSLLTKPLIQLHSPYPKLILQINHILGFLEGGVKNFVKHYTLKN